MLLQRALDGGALSVAPFLAASALAAGGPAGSGGSGTGRGGAAAPLGSSLHTATAGPYQQRPLHSPRSPLGRSVL